MRVSAMTYRDDITGFSTALPLSATCAVIQTVELEKLT